MYKCNKCHKEFKYESKLILHNKRKIPCDKINDFKCEICKINFKTLYNKQRHEETVKHKKNIEINIQGDHNNVKIKNSFNNFIQLTLNVNAFKNTDTSYVRNANIVEIGEIEYVDIMKKDYLSDIDKVKILFDSVIKILKIMHFNLNVEENHNLKILLVFPGLKKCIYEYLILEINSETKEILWSAQSYEEILAKIFDNLFELNNKHKNDNYDMFLLFLKKYLLKREETAAELKPFIQLKLSEMYKDFNKEQKKEEREIHPDLEQKIEEYFKYRKQECKLSNGYAPNIVNSEFN